MKTAASRSTPSRSAACTWDGEDTACCSSSTDCVYDGACYGNGWNGDPDGDSAYEQCDAGTWIEACTADGDLCDSDGECCSGICQDKANDYEEVSTIDYRCAAASSHCVDDIPDGDAGDAAYEHSSPQTYSGNQMLCCDGKVYRCSTTGDVWESVYSGDYVCRKTDICGYNCIMGTQPYWSTGTNDEGPSAGDTCCDGYDNDCDGDVDGTDSACVESNQAGTCDNGKDDDCDGSADWADSGCCKAEGASCSDVSECCEPEGKIAQCTGVCGTTDDCTASHVVCWNPDLEFTCVDLTLDQACCSDHTWHTIEVIY